MKPRSHACLDCPILITAKSVRCRACSTRHVNSRADVAEKRNSAIRAKFEEPAHREKMAQVARANSEKARQDPEFRAWLIEHGKRQRAGPLTTPEARVAYLATGPSRGRKRTETVLGWCPREHRAEYHHLVRAKRIPAGEAKRLILDMMAAKQAMKDRKPVVQQLSPFERQERAIQAGAGLRANDRLFR